MRRIHIFILASLFFLIPFLVRAQACVPPAISCGDSVCREPAMNSGSVCSGSGGEGTRDSCGTCVANGPRAATRQYGSYPGTPESGFIHVVGDIGSGGDMYLNSGKSVHVGDGSGTSSLNIGSFPDATNAVTVNIFGELTLRKSTGTGTARLVINQNNTARLWSGITLQRQGVETWFLGMNALDDNLLFRRAGTTNDLILDTSGNVRVNGGQLQLANLATAPVAPANPPLTGALYYSTAVGDTGVRVYDGTAWAASGICSTRFDHVTATAYNGSVNGATGGYSAANTTCGGGAGQHVCTTAELLNSINCGVVLPATGAAWVSNGVPGFTSPAVNDCGGWTSLAPSGTYGAFWDFGSKQGLATACSTSRPFACCQ